MKLVSVPIITLPPPSLVEKLIMGLRELTRIIAEEENFTRPRYSIIEDRRDAIGKLMLVG